tara:strand:+ start:73 stop:318 length:246 start_codon:yes stop_codon:yes gene_type:complete
MESIFVFLKTAFILLYFTFAKGGYIIKTSPMANGMLVVPFEKELMNPALSGIKLPMETPKAIARKIHKVKFRSRKLNFFRS